MASPPRARTRPAWTGIGGRGGVGGGSAQQQSVQVTLLKLQI
jgi:hypothetical protein